MAQKLVLPVRKYIEKLLKENYPSFDFRRSTSLNDMVANVFSMLIQPFRNELDELKVAQSLKNYDYISEDQMNDLLFNLLIFRRTGSKSFGTIRIYFYELGDYSYDQIIFLTNDGLRFINSNPISITPQNLSGNLSDDGTYFYDIAAESSETGIEYSIQSNDIVSISDTIPEIARVTNPFPFTQSDSRETNFEAFKRSQDAVITRTLINEYSIRTVLSNEFPFLRDIKVVGAGNPAMIRDLVTINNTTLHTYGKTDIYIDSTTIQQNDVDIEYVPEDLRVNISSGTTEETVFPVSGDSSTGGNSRGLYFKDAYNDFDSDLNYYNHVLRVFDTRFGADLYTDFIVKTQTENGELVVVKDKTSDGSYLIPYLKGYVNIDGFTKSHKNEFIFKGGSGSGDDYLQIVLNGANFITGIFDNTITITELNTASCSADKAYINISISSSNIHVNRHPKFIISQGDSAGEFPIVKTMNGNLLVTGQVKDTNTIDTWSSYTITLDNTMDRSVKAGDYIYATDSNGESYLLTISAVSFSVNKLFATNSVGIPFVNNTISIHDGLHGALTYGQKCFISEDWDYEWNGPAGGYSYAVGGTLVTYGIGENIISYIENTKLKSVSINIGDQFTSRESGSFDRIGTVISKIDNDKILVHGNYRDGVITAGGSYFKCKGTRAYDSSPVINGLWNLIGSGTYDSSINTVTVASGWNFYHPGIAVGSKFSTSQYGKMVFVNYSTLKTYDALSNPYSSYGINGLKFSGTSSGISDGEDWAILQMDGKYDISGGSTWLDEFSWYGTPSIDNTTISGSYPNDNPNIKLVIAGGPNKGIYDVIEIEDSNTLKLNVELDEVSTITATGIFIGSYASGATSLLGESSFPAAEEGDTLKITSGLAEGYYRILSRIANGIVIEKPIIGNVFGSVDTYEIHRDRFQPFFLISNEEAFNDDPYKQYEIWTPMGTSRRVVEGSGATINNDTVIDNNIDFSLYFNNIPIKNSTISFVSGTNSGTNASLNSYSISDASIAYMNKSLVNSTDNSFEVYQSVQNLYQQNFQIIDNLDYYIDKFFIKPIIFIQEIVEIDPTTGEIIGDPLVPNKDYFLYSRSESLKYTRYSADEKVIIKFDSSFKYKGMRITYIGDPMVTIVNQFVTGDLLRCSNNDTMVKRMESTIVNVSCEVEGIDTDLAEEIIDSYITVQKSEDPIQASDIIDLLYSSGATYVNTETFTMQSYYLPPTASGDMWIENPSSRTEITSSNHATYIPGTITAE